MAAMGMMANMMMVAIAKTTASHHRYAKVNK
jgi:hypothetical protein